MHQPPGFRDTHHPDYVCLLKKSLYGLKQAPRAWYQRFTEFVATLGFSHSACDHSSFIYHNGNDIAYILLYVDDIILTASSDTLRQYIISHLSCEFAMKDLGPISYFLGISVTRHSCRLFLSQHKYAEKIIERSFMSSCKPVSTLVDTKAKLSGLSGNPYHNPSEYRSLAGALQHLFMPRLVFTAHCTPTTPFPAPPSASFPSSLHVVVVYSRFLPICFLLFLFIISWVFTFHFSLCLLCYRFVICLQLHVLLKF
jgi:hypothetical protein